MELELCMYPMLRKRLDGSDTDQSKGELKHAIRSDEDVLFAWSLLTVHLPEIESHRLLTDIIQLWMTIRGYAIASRLFKAAINETKKGKNLFYNMRKALNNCIILSLYGTPCQCSTISYQDLTSMTLFTSQ